MTVPPALSDQLERCYRAFEDVARPTAIGASPYKSKDIVKRVMSAPVRELSDDDIGPYAGSATLTVGSPEDYRYYLPRILELSVTYNGWIGGDPPIIADHLIRSTWSTWSDDQQSAVRNFFDDAYSWSIGAPLDSVAQADLWLCGNILIGAEPSHLLARWRQNTGAEALCRLADWRCAWSDDFALGEGLPFWEDVPASARSAVSAWLLDQATEDQIKEALEKVSNEYRWQLERALAVIGSEDRH